MNSVKANSHCSRRVGRQADVFVGAPAISCSENSFSPARCIVNKKLSTDSVSRMAGTADVSGSIDVNKPLKPYFSSDFIALF